MQDQSTTEPKTVGNLLLDVGIKLLQVGATSRRINMVISRIAAAYGFTLHLDIGPKSISLFLQSTGKEIFQGFRSTPDYGVNFKILSGISTMSWQVSVHQWGLREIQDEMQRLNSLPHYPRIVVLSAVALAGASFCYTFGGDAVEMGITFGATFLGLLTKQELLKRSFNTYFCTFLSSLVAALFTGGFYKAELDLELGHAYSTCVLFLVPGVPLINSFTDLLAGNILYALNRGVNALTHISAIAFGLAAAIFIYHFHV